MSRKIVAAGILPYTLTDTGDIVVLIGQESADGTWADFGGKREQNETIWECAQRECYEESAQMLLFQKQHATFHADVRAGPMSNKYYRVYMCKMQFVQCLPKQFDANRRSLLQQKRVEPSAHNRKKLDMFLEKTQVAWMALADLVCISRNTGFTGNAFKLRHIFSKFLHTYHTKIFEMV